jgi:ABC-type sugar transport system substrate-binding protein
LKKAEDMLTANPDLKAIVAINDDMALGAVAALKARGKAGQIIVTGFNGVEEAVQEVYRGNMGATIIAFADEVGRQIVLTAIKVANKQDDPNKAIHRRHGDAPSRYEAAWAGLPVSEVRLNKVADTVEQRCGATR